MTKTKKKDFNNILFDILGWGIMGLSVWKVFFVVENVTLKTEYPWGITFLVGAACVAYTIKGVVDIGRSKLKK